MSELAVPLFDTDGLLEVEVEQCCKGAPVRRITEDTYAVLNGEQAPTPMRSKVSYECARCGRELKEVKV